MYRMQEGENGKMTIKKIIIKIWKKEEEKL